LSFTRREEDKLRKFLNRMLRRIFETKTEEAAGGRRKQMTVFIITLIT
jgi:hypothetical protein